MIPDSAIEAAHKAWREQAKQDGTIFEYNLRAAIEAAAPHMLSHEREEARLEHVELIARTLFEEPGRNWDIQPDGVKSRWLKRGRLVVSALEAAK